MSKKADTQTAERAVRVRFPISFKLVSVISLLVVIALGLATFFTAYFSSQEVRLTAEENNHTVNSHSASEAESKLMQIRSNVFLLLDMLNAASSSGALSRQTTLFFFERNADIAVINIPGERELINTKFFTSKELDSTLVNDFRVMYADSIKRAEDGETLALNASPLFSSPVIALICPWKESGFNQAVIVLFSADSLTESFSTSSLNTSYMINQDGDVLLHADTDLVLAGANMRQVPLVVQMFQNNDENRQLLFTDNDGIDYFGAYTRLSIAGLSVITTIPANRVFEAVEATTRRNIYLCVAVLALSILYIWFFSRSISTPVKRLARAAGEIKKGNFIIPLKPSTHDEVGLLTESFVSMGKGLAERERLKDTFGRFINKDIAEKAARGELTLGGESKQVTVFFSDIRSFTAISEKLSPDEVVGFLNEYMTRMVECVNKTNGVVDKFIGDAIMCVWGAPVSSGSPKLDAMNCVKAAMLMRHALYMFNKDRGGDKKPIIKIGCGINTGEVIAGQIGSNTRMEYTVIGDAVNLASRTESLNKPFCTDILVTENTYNLIKDEVIVEEMPSVKVKGKTEPVHMFAVINLKTVDPEIPWTGEKGPSSLTQIRQKLGFAEPDLAKVNTDEEEKKYSVQGK